MDFTQEQIDAIERHESAESEYKDLSTKLENGNLQQEVEELESILDILFEEAEAVGLVWDNAYQEWQAV